MTKKEPGPRTGKDDVAGLAGTRKGTLSSPGGGIGEPSRGPVQDDPPRAGPALSSGVSGREAIYERVSVLLEAGRLSEAGDLLARGLEIYPESVDLLKELGVLYHLQGRYGMASRTFTRVMNISGDGKQSLSWKIAALYHKALEEFAGPDTARSLRSFEEILALDPGDREALAGRIAALRILGRMDEAARLLEEGLSLDPPGPSILYQEGWHSMDLDRPDLASGAFERAGLADPSWPDPVFSRALAEKRLGNGAEAGRILRGYVESREGMPGLRAGLGWFSLGLHDIAGAKEIFLELTRKEDDLGAFHGLAALLLAMGRTGEAGVIMGRLARALPRDALVQVNLGMVLAREGGGRALADAAVAAQRALLLEPLLAAAITCLGIIAFRQGRPDAAGDHFTEAIRAGDPGGHRNLGLLSCARGRWVEAGPDLLCATRLDPFDARAWAGLGALALHSGNAEEAILHFRKAGSLDPHDTGAARGLAIALARCGDTQEAEEAIRRSLDRTGAPEKWVLLLDLAALLVSTGGPGANPVLDGEAKQALAEAAAIRPSEPGILFYQGVAEGRLGNMKEAIRLFSSSMKGEGYRIPAQENVRRLKNHLMGTRRFPSGFSLPRSALSLLSLLQLVASWAFFMAGLVSEPAFLLLLVIFSVLFTLATFLPVRNGEVRKENHPPELVLPEITYVPAPEADMVAPFVRLRTALRPWSGT